MTKKYTKSINYYDDSNHEYEDFWIGREYEHLSEVLAIKRLLKDHRFNTALDLGGGYGRLSSHILEYCNKLYLIDPSKKQLNIAKEKLSKYKDVEYLTMDVSGDIPVDDNKVDLLVMVRVSHHLIDPTKTFKDISRVLKPGGKAIIEVANSAHALNKLKYATKLKKVPSKPITVGEIANGKLDDTPFVNHNYKMIEKQFKDSGFKIVRKLSVSNLRNRKLKQMLGLKNATKIENHIQTRLSSFRFGPSIFYLLENSKTK
jgi:ubiquinone/menaquinone biosynthesis C-methylase UbiE